MLRLILVLFLALLAPPPQALAQDPIAALPPVSRWMDRVITLLGPTGGARLSVGEFPVYPLQRR